MNPFSSDVKVCPYPYYEEVRSQQPVQWNPEINAWLVTSYQDVLEVLKDSTTYSSKNSVFGGPELEHPEFPSMINEDEPKHKQLRNLAAKAFTPKTLGETWEPRIRQLSDELLDAAVQKETFDVIGDLAFPLPVTIIAEIIGVESERFAEFKTWSDEIAQQIGRHDAPPPENRPNIEDFEPTDLGPLFQYFYFAVADRRENPRDDLITRLVEAEIDGERLTDAEVLAFLVLLLVAGNETTTNLIGTAIRGLVKQPELMTRLRAEPKLIDGLIEEALRWDAPIQSFYRRATSDVTLNGQEVKAGDALLILYAAANWDPKEFACPADLDVERKRRDHLSFGMGTHYCLGANLARLEAKVAIEGVLARFETLSAPEGYAEIWRDTPFFRGMSEYPLSFTRVASVRVEAGVP